MKNHSIAWLMILPALITLSCGTARKMTASVPAESKSLPPLPASQINVPVKIYMQPLLAQMDSSTARSFTNTGWPDYTQTDCDFRYKYQFIRSPFRFSCTNNQVQIDFDGQYQIAGSRCLCAFNKQVSPWVSGSCGFGEEPLRKVKLRIRSDLQLLPDHRMMTSTHLSLLQPMDRCQVTLLQNDLTSQVLDSIRASVESYCLSFDHFVQSVNSNPFLSQWRAGGNRVMPLGHYGFLNLRPGQLIAGPLNSRGDSLEFTLGFTGAPLFSSDSGAISSPGPLPPVAVKKIEPGINAYLDAGYEFSSLNKLLNDSLYNKVFEVEGRSFVIKEISVSGNKNGELNLDLRFAGNRSGVLHFSGTPALDTARQLLSMPDIHYDLDTRDMLLNMAKGLLRKRIMKELKGHTVLDIGELVRRNLPALNARLAYSLSPWLRSSGQISDLKLIGILVREDRLEIQIYLKAQLTLSGTPPASLLGGF